MEVGRIIFGTQNLEVFLLAGITLNLIPGQDTLYIIGRSLAHGRVAGIVPVLDISSGCIFLWTGTTSCLIVAFCVSSLADALRDNPNMQRGFYWFTRVLSVGLGIRVLFSPNSCWGKCISKKYVS